ncbi:exodeoxyribonuclease 7 large subunit [Candidatus Phycosocius bacilliformis]|uniref:Exodeoxyribonuclease 7 large subunit n=1 Tax=Candidatus Phycosocius bacilliformis TaxID=1445552 RepID=A0A2P2EE80_9PROT|nr:exodeoxyribonuclease VII large subunit [Candidatus Phycosocius bacilliformis]GBF59367.1 exodeoxyribonuclease 7 large subunit [Candidatus Phycosocius bacilliformis]
MSQEPSNAPEFSVSELSGAIKRRLEDDFGNVRVRGEMGRVTIARSGHVYVDLKDANAVLSAVMWKGVAAALRFRPEEGMEVIATGKISTFPGSSKYQLIIERLEPAGVGALLAQLEERRKRLAAEGLFDPARKQALPYLPEVIGVVSSPTGAVIKDILHRLSERFPVHVLLWPVLVQGDKAADQVARAIAGFNRLPADGAVPRPDVLIVARGGGSIEDLWAFNEEVVVRAAAASTIPLISAIGHETDTTLIDFASDRRAPTPTGAAEMAVPVRLELQERVNLTGARLSRAMVRGLERGRIELRAAAARLPRPDTLFNAARQRMDVLELRFGPSLRNLMSIKGHGLAAIGGRLRPQVLRQDITRKQALVGGLEQRLTAAFTRRTLSERDALTRAAQRLDVASQRLSAALSRHIDLKSRQLAGQASLLEALSYRSALARGFAVVRTEKGTVVRGKAEVRPDARLTLTFVDGEVKVRATDGPVQASLFD